ncbi:hypothetical protein N7497_012252 [Penicillium chrysogenum]|uniref:Uncharacterized protein n=1 Tax=Penicillium chrysogenum TaxID=5076 RepID=A0ABQ8W8Y3_PENCH|nr:hypothetical protein N7505_009773 [Penicillium chrysogenum]KAJ6137000.1 hypothetical protein N7497_012252 [Penicillium chrysogenum]
MGASFTAEIFKSKAANSSVEMGLERTRGRLNVCLDETHTDSIPDVLRFAAPDRLVDLNLEIRRLFSIAHENVSMNDNDPVPTGLYSESVHRGDYDMEEAGFRLVLPFALRPGFFRDEEGARVSDWRPVTSGSFTELFQHGYFHPLGVLVESGVWTVGEDGVKGGIDKFGDADRGAWNECSIAPSW